MKDNNISLKSDEMYCSSCGKPIKKAAEVCPHCGVRQRAVQQTMKSPGTAAIASFLFAGLGQIYNGEFAKGLGIMIIQVINVVLMFLIIGFLTYPIVWILGIYDAYKSAERINAKMLD